MRVTISPTVAASLRAGRHTEIGTEGMVWAPVILSVNAFIQSG
jgi:hypothetical protein